MDCANLLAEQVWWRERWQLLRKAWLVSTALAPSFQPVVSRAQQHEGQRGQAQESEQEWGVGRAWACLHVTRSSEHKRGEFRQAQTELQECDGRIQIAEVVSFAL
jgi:hypothetical protein